MTKRIYESGNGEFDAGYQAAVEQLRKAIEGQKDNSNSGGSGLSTPNSQQQGQGQGQSQNQPGQGKNQKPIENKGTDGKPMGSVSDAIDKGPASLKKKAQKNAQQGQGQGDGQQGQGGGQGESTMSSNAQDAAAGSDVGATGGGVIDQDAAIEIAKRAGYDEDADIKKSGDITNEWKNAVKKAMEEARAGSELGSTLIAISNLYKTSKNWKNELKKYEGKALGRINLTQKWGKKRDLALFDEITQYNKKDPAGLSEVVFAIDASGSTSGEMFRRILSECYTIAKQKGVDVIDILPFDTAVREHFKLRNEREIKKMEFEGGGGTDVIPVFKYLNKNLKKPAELVMIFSDGGFNDIPKRISKMKNLIWVIYNNMEFAERFERSGAKDSKTKLVCIKDDDI